MSEEHATPALTGEPVDRIFPSGTGTIPTWRGVTDVYDSAV